jgi:hypothetical protein
LNKILKEIKNKIFYVSPKKIKYCICPSKFCDYNQFDLNRIHPHAGVNRGVFDENPYGYLKINSTDWDKKPGVMFVKLLEFIALKDHFTGKINWKKSLYAQRNVNFIKSNNKNSGFTNYKDFLIKREKQVDGLFNSIIKKGMCSNDNFKKNKIRLMPGSHNDNITVVLTKDNQLFFNNRGHHRLSIAKILKLKEIHINIVVAKSIKMIENFNLSNK